MPVGRGRSLARKKAKPLSGALPSVRDRTVNVAGGLKRPNSGSGGSGIGLNHRR